MIHSTQDPRNPRARAITLLQEYDRREAELRRLKHALAMAASDYGRSRGVWGFSADHLRRELAAASSPSTTHTKERIA